MTDEITRDDGQPAAPTPGRLEEIRARADAATPGPWRAVHRDGLCTSNDDEQGGLGLEIEGPEEAWGRGQFHRAADALFIAHSRADVPWLLAHIDALTAERDAARVWSARWKALAGMKRFSFRGCLRRLQELQRHADLVTSANHRLCKERDAATARADAAEAASAALLASADAAGAALLAAADALMRDSITRSSPPGTTAWKSACLHCTAWWWDGEAERHMVRCVVAAYRAVRPAGREGDDRHA